MGDQPLSEWAQLILGSIGGAFGTFVAMRTRLYGMTRDISDAKAEAKRDVEALSEVLGRVERRQIVTLQVLANVARKAGVDHRAFDDALVRMLTDDANASANTREG